MTQSRARRDELAALGRDELEAISLGWEGATGADSIDTIERVYDRTSSGAFRCVYPRCEHVRRDAPAMWLHVHTAHVDEPPQPRDRPALPPADFDPGPWL